MGNAASVTPSEATPEHSPRRSEDAAAHKTRENDIRPKSAAERKSGDNGLKTPGDNGAPAPRLGNNEDTGATHNARKDHDRRESAGRQEGGGDGLKEDRDEAAAASGRGGIPVVISPAQQERIDGIMGKVLSQKRTAAAASDSAAGVTAPSMLSSSDRSVAQGDGEGEGEGGGVAPASNSHIANRTCKRDGRISTFHDTMAASNSNEGDAAGRSSTKQHKIADGMDNVHRQPARTHAGGGKQGDHRHERVSVDGRGSNEDFDEETHTESGFSGSNSSDGSYTTSSCSGSEEDSDEDDGDDDDGDCSDDTFFVPEVDLYRLYWLFECVGNYDDTVAMILRRAPHTGKLHPGTSQLT